MKLTLAAGLLFASLAAAAPITDEDVVRLFVSGSSVEEIIVAIADSEVDFDLSDEMIYELRAAGLPQELIGAMIDRQAEMRTDPEPPPALEEPAGASLRIEIETRKPLRLMDFIDEETRELLRLRQPDSRFTDVAIFLACLTQDHVPDHWRGKSPLGRDFISMPRHRMLYFHSGAAPTKLRKMLKLELPSAIEVELTPGVAHDLMLGVALRAEEKYHLMVFDEWKGLVLKDGGTLSGAVVSVGKDRRHSSVSVQLH